MSDSVRLHRRQPTRLPRPWDPPGKNTGVGCHFLLQDHSKQAKTNPGEPRSDPCGVARWLFFCLGTQFPQRAPGSRAVRAPVAAYEPQPHFHTQFQQSWETPVHPCLSRLSKTSKQFICLCSSSPFRHQDSVKSGNLRSAQDKQREEEAINDVKIHFKLIF